MREKPKFRYADFHRNFAAGKIVDTNGDKSWNHEVSVKVADTNHDRNDLNLNL